MIADVLILPLIHCEMTPCKKHLLPSYITHDCALKALDSSFIVILPTLSSLLPKRVRVCLGIPYIFQRPARPRRLPLVRVCLIVGTMRMTAEVTKSAAVAWGITHYLMITLL